ncbi:MAG: alpha/beta fold hydrolase [Gammaproteobacteria bacterium]|nr:alpha/beta fold hydrolase [Gammaproteobacteria bacterium]
MHLKNNEHRLVGRWPSRLEHADGRALDAERGVLLVPSSRRRDESTAIALPFIRVPARRNHGLPPLVVLFGGPGVGAIESFQGYFFAHVERLSAICDVVTFDQRGCHGALPDLVNAFPPDCDLDEPMTRESFLTAQRDSAARLGAYWRERGVDLSDYNTVESAHDVDDLRKALGAERVNLYGASYGSHLGLMVLRLHDDHVERAILCLVEGPDDTHKLPGNVDRHFRHLADIARADANLDGTCNDLFGEFAAVLDELERTPAEGNVKGVEHPLRIGKFGLQCVLGNALGSTRAMRGLPGFARQLQRRDYAALVRRFDRWRVNSTVHGMMLAMDHAAGASPERTRQIEKERADALLDDSFNLPFPYIGRELGVTELDDAFRTPVQSDTPTLFCAGTLDGRTPVSNAEAALCGFPNGQLIVVDGMGHEEPTELRDAQVGFLEGRDVAVERLSIPFKFDAIAI